MARKYLVLVDFEIISFISPHVFLMMSLCRFKAHSYYAYLAARITVFRMVLQVIKCIVSVAWLSVSCGVFPSVLCNLSRYLVDLRTP